MMKKVALISSALSENTFPLFYLKLKQKAEKYFPIQLNLLKNGEFRYSLGSKDRPKIYLNNTIFPIDSYDLAFARLAIKNPGGENYYILRAFEQQKIPVINPTDSIVKASDKFFTLQILDWAGLSVTPSIIVRSHKELCNINDFPPPYIIKNCFGSGGKGILLARDKNQLKSIFDYIWHINRNEVLLIQPFVYTEPIHDVRVLCMNYIAKRSILRLACPGEFRSNLAAGGTPKMTELTGEEKQHCEQAARALNLPFCGIDLLRTPAGPILLEVNSCPGLVGISNIYRQYDVDIMNEVIEFLYNYSE